MKRISLAWLLAAPALFAGAAWISIYAITATLHMSWVPYLNHAVGGLLGGLVLGHVAPLVGVRQLALAIHGAVGGILVFALVFVVQEPFTFSWAPSRAESPWLIVAALAAVSAAAAVAGAWLTGRRPRSVAPPIASWMVVSGLVTMGLLVIVIHTISLDEAAYVGLVVMLIAGALTQLVMPQRHVWAAGSGAFVLMLFVLDRYRGGELAAGEVAKTLFSVAIVMVPVGAVGASLAWRLCGGDATADEPELPSARAQ